MKAIAFHVQDFKKSSHQNVGYEEYLQEWYDLARSFKFDKMCYIDSTSKKDVPHMTSSSTFTKQKYDNVIDVVNDHRGELKPIVMIAENEFENWKGCICTDIEAFNSPKDNFMLIFGRDTGGLTKEEISELKDEVLLCHIPTPFGGAFHSHQAGAIALWEWNKKWQ